MSDGAQGTPDAGPVGAGAALAAAPEVEQGDKLGEDGHVTAGALARAGGGLKGPIVPEWAKEFDHDTQKVVSESKWLTPLDAVTSYKNLRSLSDDGARVRVPSSADDTEGWKALYAKLGTPETADGYDFPEVQLKEGEIDITPKVRELSHQFNLTQDQAAGMLQEMQAFSRDTATRISAEYQAETERAFNDVTTSWGSNKDKNLETVGVGLRALNIDTVKAEALEQALGTKDFLEMMLHIGTGVGSSHGQGGGSPAGGLMTQEQALAEISTHMADSEWVKGMQDGDTDKRSLWNSWHQIAYGQEERT
jgi:hypothetical protein